MKVPGVPKKRFGIPKKDVDKVVRRGLRLRFAPGERSESLRAWRYLTSGLMSFREERFSLFFGFCFGRGSKKNLKKRKKDVDKLNERV